MLGLLIYLVMVLLPVLIPLGVTVSHAFGGWRNGPTMSRRIPAAAR